MSGLLTPTRLYLAAAEGERAELLREYRERRSASLVWDAVEALAGAGLDVTVPHAVPEPVAVAQIAVRHRGLIGRVEGFGPDDYAEMVCAVRAVLGEVHPDDVADLAGHDLWETQDRWTGEPTPEPPLGTRPPASLLAMLRGSAAASL